MSHHTVFIITICLDSLLEKIKALRVVSHDTVLYMFANSRHTEDWRSEWNCFSIPPNTPSEVVDAMIAAGATRLTPQAFLETLGDMADNNQDIDDEVVQTLDVAGMMIWKLASENRKLRRDAAEAAEASASAGSKRSKTED